MLRNFGYIISIIFLFCSHASHAKSLIEAESVFEVHSYDNFRNQQGQSYQNSHFINETAITVNFTNSLKLESEIIIEEIPNDQDQLKSRNFDNQGAFIEGLKLEYQKGDFAIFGGKFGPNFGKAFDWGRGIWTHTLAENYEPNEKLGGGFSYSKFGHDLAVSFFHSDEKFLDGSVTTNREGGTRNDGSPGNTDNFNSFNISLEGENIFNLSGLSYHLAYLNLATDPGTLKDHQKGMVLALNYQFNPNQDFALDALIEYAGINNLDGDSSKRERYKTANLITTYQDKWLNTIGYANHVLQNKAALDVDSNLYELSFGYRFSKRFILPNLTIEAGYKHQTLDDGSNNYKQDSVGLLARYILKF